MILKDAITVGVLAVLFFGLAALTFSQHRSWHDRSTSAAGTRCCDKDCVQAAGRLIAQAEAGTVLEVNGALVTLSPQSVHASEDGAFWVCLVGGADVNAPLRSEQIRCAFLAAGG